MEETKSIWAFICCMIQVLWCFPEPLLPDLLDLTDKDSSEWNLSGDEVEGTRETLTCGESFVWLLNSLKWCAYFDWLLFFCVPVSLSESGEEPEEAETRVMRSHRTSRGRTKDSSWPESILKERKKLKLEWKEIGEEEEKDEGKKSESDLCLKGQEVATKKGILKESLSRARGEKKRKSGAKRVRFNLKRTDEPSSDSDDMYVQDWVTGMKNHDVAVSRGSGDLLFESDRWDDVECDEDSDGFVDSSDDDFDVGGEEEEEEEEEEEDEEEEEKEEDEEEEEEEEEKEEDEEEEEEEEEEKEEVEEENEVEEEKEEEEEAEEKEDIEDKITSMSFPGEGVRYIPPHSKEGSGASGDRLRGRVSEMLRKKVQGLINR